MNAGILDKVVRNAKLLINYNKQSFSHYSRYSFGKFSSILLCSVVLCLSGCDSWGEKSIAQICQDSPSLCNDLNPDAWCRSEKAEIIRHRFNHQNEATEKQNYDMLLKWEDYKVCIAKAAGIRHIKHREKEAGRMKGLLTAERELKRLAWKTKNAENPYLAYYHWSRFSDTDARARFMRFAKDGSLYNDPALLVALASIQIKTDEEAARNTLYEALERVDKDNMVESAVFLSLSTLAIDRDNVAAAYLWATVASHFNAPVDIPAYRQMAIASNVNTDEIESKAEEVIDNLQDGKFNAYRAGIHKL